MKNNKKILLFFFFFIIFIYSCSFIKTLTEDEFMKAIGKDNPNLSLLGVPPCVLSEPFSSDKTNYTASLPSNISSIAITAKTEIDEASIKVNGIKTQNNSFSQPVDVSLLNTGESIIINIEVKTDYFDKKKNYQITATKTTTPLSFIEDFETGDFSKYGWVIQGNVPLTVQNEIKYQGLYAAEFGRLHYYDNKKFSTFISNTIPLTISFYYFKNSSYSNMRIQFLIDYNIIESLSSTNWAKYSYALNSGNHILTWEIPDSMSWGINDFAWIDNIVIQ